MHIKTNLTCFEVYLHLFGERNDAPRTDMMLTTRIVFLPLGPNEASNSQCSPLENTGILVKY